MTTGVFRTVWMPGVLSKTPSVRRPPPWRTKPSLMPSGDHAGIRSGLVVVIGAGATVVCVSPG